MKKKISVIMCVYNTAKYLNKSINSILNQTYENIEFIIINDGSTDESLTVLQKIIKNNKSKKEIILVDNKKNMGAAYCRNLGIEKASGEYIGFIDSDDYVDENYYNQLYECLIKTKSDIAVCDIQLISDDKTEVVSATTNSFSKLDFVNSSFAASSCNKLFKKDLIKKYPYPNGFTPDDIATVIPCLITAKKVAYVNNVYYNYIERNDSIQHMKYTDKKLDVFEVINMTLARIKNISGYDKYEEVLVFNQLILVLLYYIIPLNISIFKRTTILRKYSKNIKKYNIVHNKTFNHFLNEQGKFHRLYYKLIVLLNHLNLNFIASFIISFGHFYQKRLVKNVIPCDINYQDIIELGKKQKLKKNTKKTISVIIPNYNYEDFILQRLYSILNQTVKIEEIIILDDHSTDNSQILIDKLVDDLSAYINITKVYNKKNSGSAFKQWEKGFKLAKSDYIWIAEADDYSNHHFLNKVLQPCLKDNDIIISYCDTAFINTKGKVILKSVKNQIDLLKSMHWNKNYIYDGIEEFNSYAYLNCTIANVSSCIIKNGNYNDLLKISTDFKQAGDWLFYANLMHKGKISYNKCILNYYRIHGNNVTSNTKKKNHLQEIKAVHQYFDETYKLNQIQKKQIEERYLYLKKTWNLNEED